MEMILVNLPTYFQNKIRWYMGKYSPQLDTEGSYSVFVEGTKMDTHTTVIKAPDTSMS